MTTLSHVAHRAKDEPSRRFLLTYRRIDWEPTTASKYRYFSTEDEARGFLGRLRALARFGPVAPRLELREGGRWREIALSEVAR